MLPSGTVSFADGESTKTITVNVAGDSNIEPDESFLVTLSNASNNATITTATSTASIRNDDATVTPKLAVLSTDANKNKGNAVTTRFSMIVTRGDSSVGNTTVDYTVTGSTDTPATADDFAGGIFPSGTVNFEDGQSIQTLSFNIVNDTAFETDEFFVVTLSNASSNATIVAPTTLGTIRNDDVATPSTLSIAANNADQNEGDRGVTPSTFTVTCESNFAGQTTVDFAVTGAGGADASDFVDDSFPAGTVTFLGGETTQTITVNVSGDNTTEQAEPYTVTLLNPNGDATISIAHATGTIRDDDFLEREPRILVPDLVIRPHVIPGDNIPSAIIFQTLADTTVTATPIGTASVGETIRILDGNTNPISSYANGISTATIDAGGLHSVVFGALASNGVYTIRSSAGFDSLSNSPLTNIFEPADTNTACLACLAAITEARAARWRN